MRNRHGHSLIESLVVVAIIMVMLAVTLPHYAKAIRLAKQVSADEAKYQRYIGNIAGREHTAAVRETACMAYRQLVNAGKFETAVTQVLFVVTNDAQFEAYWNTLINPANNDTLEFDGESLIATDLSGNTHVLKPVWNSRGELTSGRFPLEWDFLSTNMADMTVANNGATVQFASHQEYVPYPGAFPITPKVAELSRRFMVEVWPTL